MCMHPPTYTHTLCCGNCTWEWSIHFLQQYISIHAIENSGRQKHGNTVRLPSWPLFKWLQFKAHIALTQYPATLPWTKKPERINRERYDIKTVTLGSPRGRFTGVQKSELGALELMHPKFVVSLPRSYSVSHSRWEVMSCISSHFHCLMSSAMPVELPNWVSFPCFILSPARWGFALTRLCLTHNARKGSSHPSRLPFCKILFANVTRHFPLLV